MSYHASDPNMTTARTYVDTSQPLMGLGGDTAMIPTSQSAVAFPFQYANMREADPLIAPWVSDADMLALSAVQFKTLPPAQFAFGPWIPNEGPIARTVAPVTLSDNPDPMAMMLANWLGAMTTGQMTGTPLYIVMGIVNGQKVLYAVNLNEYKSLPANTYQTVAIVGNYPSTKANLQAEGLLYGPVLNGGAPAGGGGTFPSLPGGNWGNVFPASIPGVGGGGIWPFPSPGAGGSGTTQPAQPAQPGSAGISVAGLTGGALLVLVAAAAGAYYLYSRPGGFRMNGHRSSHDLDDEC